MVKVYIDGQEGTTGLKILERFKNRSDIELLRIDEDKRKDPEERRKLIHSADFTFLCLAGRRRKGSGCPRRGQQYAHYRRLHCAPH